MTDPNYTAMLLVIDRSGSMAGIRDDMVGGLTAMLAEQAAEPGLLTVDIVTFDTEIETQCSLADPKDVTVTLEPRGGTALFDAIGQSVTGFGRVLAALPEHARPETVQVVVVTDGHENASREFSLDAVRALVTHQKEQYSWDFMFLGANQDAVLSGERLGFDAGSSMTFMPSPTAVTNMSAVDGALRQGRARQDEAHVRRRRSRRLDEHGPRAAPSVRSDASDLDSVEADDGQEGRKDELSHRSVDHPMILGCWRDRCRTPWPRSCRVVLRESHRRHQDHPT